MTSSPNSVKDGWNKAPMGWNHIDVEEYQDNIFEGNLDDYDHDYIFVLAGGLDHLGRNHPWVKDRLDLALELYKRKTRRIFILGGGTYHKPPHLNREKFVIHESTMGAKYLIDRGVSKEDIYREWTSYDTIANAMFGLLHFIGPMEIDRFLVITSDFHMPRSREIFKWIFGLHSRRSGKEYKIDFVDVSSKYLDNEIVEARSARERRSLERLIGTIEKIQTWKDFHRWFYLDHQAYNCNFEGPRERIDLKTSQSY